MVNFPAGILGIEIIKQVHKRSKVIVTVEATYYDYLVEGFKKPFNAHRGTKPIVIIDEPHRFSREQKAYKAIVEELQPQMIIRFGATFPEVSVGRGRNKVTYKDLNNLVYELNACDSFNQNLIKGVAKEHFETLSQKEFIKRINNQTSIPIKVIHDAMCKLAEEKTVLPEHINEYSSTNIIRGFTDWRIQETQTRFRYAHSTQPVTETTLTYEDGSPREMIRQGTVGTMFVEGTPSEKYLYDKIAFDSPLEKDNIMNHGHACNMIEFVQAVSAQII